MLENGMVAIEKKLSKNTKSKMWLQKNVQNQYPVIKQSPCVTNVTIHTIYMSDMVIIT